jgi:hypothetical protein
MHCGMQLCLSGGCSHTGEWRGKRSAVIARSPAAKVLADDGAYSCAQTPYYLITDADTFFLRSFEALDLLHQEMGCDKTSGVCDLQKQVRRHLQVLCGTCGLSSLFVAAASQAVLVPAIAFQPDPTPSESGRRPSRPNE